MRLIIILAIGVQVFLGSGLGAQPAANAEGQTYRQIEVAILDMNIESALETVAKLPDENIRKVYESLIKSYEFSPETYDPMVARNGLVSFLEPEFLTPHDKPADNLLLQATASIALSRHLICNAWPNLELISPRRLPMHWSMWTGMNLGFVDRILDKYKSDPTENWDNSSRRSSETVEVLRREALGSVIAMSIYVLITRHADDDLNFNENYLDYLTSSIGSCMTDLAIRERKYLANVQKILPNFGWAALDPTPYILVVQYGLGKEIAAQASNYLKNTDIDEIEKIVVPRMRDMSKTLVFSEADLVERYCKMAFTFATAQQLKSSAAYNNCIKFHTNSG